MTNPAPGDWRLAVYGARSSHGTYRTAPRRVDQTSILTVQGDVCLYCEIPIGTTIWRRYRASRRYRSLTVVLRRNWDHFVPYAFLEQNPNTNWVLACHVCNAIKTSKMFDTVESARRVILAARESKGYEPVRQVLMRLALDSMPEQVGETP